MLKKLIIIIITILVVLFWLSIDSGEEYDNYNDVIIKYQCDDLDSYKNVPVEVIQECKSRGFSVKENI